jgi:benzoyl-CoA reductase/2-hydroxyglutaryl-CoA dehydratase subunit BcrC/BadD/HgdB
MAEKDRSQVLDKFSRIAGTISNPSVAAFRAKGGRVMGYTCSFVPEELFIAAGMMPFRIRATGSKSAGRADDYFEAANICSLVRHTFGKVLSGEYDFIDGAVIGGGCDGNRHILDNWEKSPARIPFLDRIFIPHASNELAAQYFLGQLSVLRAGIEGFFNVSITDDKLWAAIKLCNETRALQRELYALRLSDSPPITGAETIAVIVAGSSMPKEEYNSDLKQLLEELRGVKTPTVKYKARVMIVGPGHDDTSMCDIVEQLGGLVVNDLTCFGGKVVFGSITEDGADPLKAIADYQVLTRPLCPKNLGAHALINRKVFDTIKEFRVDGVIGQVFLCCETWGGEIYILGKELKEAGIPLLRIERECTADSTGQLMTRVQAFIETISGGAL